VLAVYPEGSDVDAAVASVDVIHGEIDEVRWLDDRLSQNDRDRILDRLDRALWDAFDETEEEDDADDDAEPRPSPLQELIDLMDRRSSALGARAANTANLKRKRRLRPHRRGPAGPGAADRARRRRAAALARGRGLHERRRGRRACPRRRVAAGPPDHARALERRLRGAHARGRRGRPGAMRLPEEAIFRDDDASAVVLQRVRKDERAILRRIRVRADEPDPETGDVTIEDPSGRLAVADQVHRAERPESLLVDLYGKLGAFHDDLERAPKTLQDVRTLLYWAAVMLDAPLCQGEVKARAAAAFTQAKAYHDTARQRLLEGRSVDAVRRHAGGHAAHQRRRGRDRQELRRGPDRHRRHAAAPAGAARGLAARSTDRRPRGGPAARTRLAGDRSSPSPTFVRAGNEVVPDVGLGTRRTTGIDLRRSCA
jgi:hypothetical protein